MNDDRALAEEAVARVAEYLNGLKLTPHGFSAQMALCQLLEIADEDPASEVAQWILRASRDTLWRTDPDGMFVEGDEPRHELFREAWGNYCLSQLPVM